MTAAIGAGLVLALASAAALAQQQAQGPQGAQSSPPAASQTPQPAQGPQQAKPQGQTAPAPPKTHLKVGDVAPDFTLPDTKGQPVHLADFRGKKNVLLAFYVLAFTGG